MEATRPPPSSRAKEMSMQKGDALIVKTVMINWQLED